MTKSSEIAVQPGSSPRSRILWVIPVAAVVLIGMVTYRHLRPLPPPVSPDVLAASVRPVPLLYELMDQRSQLVRLKTYIGRHKLLVVFVKSPPGKTASPIETTIDSSKAEPPRESELLQTVRRDYAEIQQAGAILHVISNTTPWNNRQKEERDQRFPFSILSDLDGSVHRAWGAFDSRNDQILEAVCVVDRKGFIKRTFLGPEHLGTPSDWVAALK